MDIKQQIKEYLLKENLTMIDLVNILNEDKPKEEQTTASSLNNKLTRGSIKHSEVIEIAQAMGYDIVWQKPNKLEYSSSGVLSSSTGAIVGGTVGSVVGGFAGGVLGFIGGMFGSDYIGKSGNTTGSKEKNIITGQQAIKNAKQFEEINGYNPIMTDDELYEMELQQDRLDLEHDVEVNIQAILDYIVLDCEPSVHEKYKDLINAEDLPVSFKLTSLYRVVFKLLSVQSDAGLRTFISGLRNLYVHGGLMDANDDELMRLFEISRYYRDLLTDKEND